MPRNHGVQTAKSILKVLSAGVVVTTAITAPNAVQALAPLLKDGQDKPDDIPIGLAYGIKRGWVVWKETGKGVELAVTEKGRVYWQRLQISQPLYEKHWDQNWRLVIFDIPNTKKKARDTLRLAMKQLGLKQLQESVWVSPYPCGDEITYLRNLYGINPFVRIVEGQIENDQNLRDHFKLT